ncbi:MAG: D-alanine--D-alanine ligase [Planctomycetota bacterium]|nr:MAG: D-alanine--D-alanine ligase [Planctomycetota bacterium]
MVLTLERAGVPFTGASSGFYEPSREQMKAACRRAGIAAPAGRVVSSLEEAERVAAELRYPLFVKHPSSYSSVDLTRHSRVCSPAGLRRQAAKMIRRHGAALIEEFVAGIECTVLVAENPDDSETPITYTPIAYRFPPGESFKHARLKWEDYAGLEAAPVADPVLAARLRRESAAFFRAIGGAGFGRCDIRVDPEGTPWFLEINPNCGVFYPPTDPGSADLCLAHDPAGHAGFARTLVQAALARHARRSGGRPGKDAQPPEPPSSWRTTIGT